MTEGTKMRLAIFLCSTWAALTLFEVMNQPSPERVPLRFKSGMAPNIADSHAHESDNPFTVRLARVKTHELPHLPSHNIFASLDSPSSESAARPAKKRTAPSQMKPPQPLSPAPIVTEPAPVPAPPSELEIATLRAIQEAELARLETTRELAAFRFLGFLERDGVAQVFLARGSELYVVANGDIVEGKYAITVIDTSSVKIRATRTGVEATIGKSEREPIP